MGGFPLAVFLMSVLGIGSRTDAQILLTINDASAFESCEHLADFAGIASVTRRSSNSIRGEFPPDPATGDSRTPSATPPGTPPSPARRP